ncbi:MAG TPA: ketosynthase chain-length factor [Actinocrinis sp.]|uniref:ketosynthase chain-length factor n=1 Tax=Actinocrinis sp. TaxID=1920516 RepID=UPI002DDD8507|nr:ketosynthase chain-length factor [Actinocrinis sp.]HEV3173011.1 ketosynthase chain-length factor [Actinocrinis sp.]
MSAAAVITGIGVTAPNGIGVEEYWAAALAGRGGIGAMTRFDASSYPAQLAGQVPGFVDEDHVPSRLMPQTDRHTRLALAAAHEALTDAAVDPEALPEYNMGVVTAASGGGVEFGQNELGLLWSQGKEHVSAYQSFAWFYAVNTGQVSIRYGMRGPSGVIVTEQAGGLDSLGHARRQLRKGTTLVVSGGVDGALCPWGWAGQLATGLLSTSKDPNTAYQPFAATASGYVPGEGGAILIIEDEEAARQRGAARVYGELAGYAATLDPRPGVAPAHGESGLLRAARGAIADAGLTPSDVDVVFADAAGVPELDRIEAAALVTLFGPRGVPVTAPKTMTGRLMAGGAALDVATALLSIRDGVIPPTVNVPEPAPGLPIDLVVGRPRQIAPLVALVLARGYGGFNAAVCVRG